MRRIGRLQRRARAARNPVSRTHPGRHRRDSRARRGNRTSRPRTSPRAKARPAPHPLSKTRADRCRRKVRPPVRAAHRAAAAARPVSQTRAARAMAHRLRRRVRAQASRRHRSPSHRLTISRRPKNNSKHLEKLGPASAGPLFLLGAFCVTTRPSLARFMRVRARRQGNNDSYQQENHDELGMFNHEGDHGIHTDCCALWLFLVTARLENINSAVAQM